MLIGEIYKLKAAEKFICQLIDQKGVPNELKNFTVIEYSNNFLSFIEIKNQSSKEISVDIDCSKSENCLSNNNNDLTNTVTLKPDKSKLAMILTARKLRKDWCTRCNIISNSKPTSARYD